MSPLRGYRLKLANRTTTIQSTLAVEPIATEAQRRSGMHRAAQMTLVELVTGCRRLRLIPRSKIAPYVTRK